jgi:hypothetical protein
MVSLHAQYADEKTSVLIVGEEGRRELVTYYGNSFVARSQNLGMKPTTKYDVSVEIGLKPSMAAILDEIDFYISRGILHPQIHREAILAAIREGDTSRLDPGKQDRITAAEENEKWLMFQDEIVAGRMNPDDESALQNIVHAVRVLPSHGPAIHNDLHEDLMNRYGYELHPVLIQAITMHMMGHTQVMQMSMAQFGGGQQQPGMPSRPASSLGGNGSTPGVTRNESVAFSGR